MRASHLLVHVLREPGQAARLSRPQWDLLVRQARAAGLLARLHDGFSERGLLDGIPSPARWHFEAAATLTDKQQRAVRWEVGQICAALADLDIPIVVLKGAAYVVAGLPAARGRLFNDIDILVPRALLNRTEAALMLGGWQATGLSPYDERYYRQWMHEIPPLQHLQRATVIDVHHAILPDTTRHLADPQKLFGRILPTDIPGAYVLSAEDRILHSTAHLFHDGELPHGLRDLCDLDLLLRDEVGTPDFWMRLTARARELQLDRSLFYALRYLRHFLDTPVPDDVDAALAESAPGPLQRAWMDAIFRRALAPMHTSCEDALTPAARMAAYVRAHWLRMPPRLLIPHLFHKAFISPWEREPKPA